MKTLLFFFQSLIVLVFAAFTALCIFMWRNARTDEEATFGMILTMLGLLATFGRIYLWFFARQVRK
ncbi:MAG TPA: hypothetical protein VEC13_00455 [Candidatus Paceibacterota bacterium]|nr:hypothetical protein [Candidatus Paceibacterota bacterium]